MTAALSWLWHAPGSALGHVRNNRILIGKNPKIYCNKRMILACWTPLRAANLDYCSLGERELAAVGLPATALISNFCARDRNNKRTANNRIILHLKHPAESLQQLMSLPRHLLLLAVPGKRPLRSQPW